MEEDDTTEQTARLENTAIDAMATLVAEYGYSAEDLGNLIEAAVGNA